MSSSTRSQKALATSVRHQGMWPGRMPYLAVGTGEPLLFIPGLGPHNEPPKGMERRFQAAQIMPFADHRKVWWVNRKPYLDPDVTMADIATQYATAMRARLETPVDVIGVSTGGSVALQLAIDHPDVVKRLVILSAAYRLGEAGAQAQRRVGQLIRAGEPRKAAAEIMSMLATDDGAQPVLGGIGWLMGKAMFGKAGADMLATIDAEDEFNVRDRLHEITAPTLVVGGDKDHFYSAELFRQTADLIPGARLILYPGRGHVPMAGTQLVPDVMRFLDAPG